MNEENLENLNTKKMLFETKQKTSECGGDTLSKKSLFSSYCSSPTKNRKEILISEREIKICYKIKRTKKKKSARGR